MSTFLSPGLTKITNIHRLEIELRDIILRLGLRRRSRKTRSLETQWSCSEEGWYPD